MLWDSSALLLDEILELVQPKEVLAAVLVDHVLVQEVGGHRGDSPQLQVLVERPLQVLVEVAAPDRDPRCGTASAKQLLIITQEIKMILSTYLKSGPSYAISSSSSSAAGCFTDKVSIPLP